MLTQKDVDKICIDTLSKLNLQGGCRDFLSSVQGGNYDTAAAKLSEAIALSISRCIYEVISRR